MSTAIAGMALHMAAHNGDVDRLRYLLRNVAQPQPAPTRDGHEVFKRDTVHTVDLRGSDGSVPSTVEVEADDAYKNVNLRDFDEHTPLHIACIFGHAAAAHLLIEKGADIHAEDENGQTPLHYAARYCREECAKVLLQQETCDANRQDHQYLLTPLHFAATHGNVKLMRMLLVLAGSSKQEMPSAMASLLPCLPSGEQQYLAAIRNTNRSLVDINAQTKGGETALHDAAHNKHIDAIRLLLRFAGNSEEVKSDSDINYPVLNVNARSAVQSLTPLAIVKAWTVADAESAESTTPIVTQALKDELVAQLEACGGHV